MAQASRSLLVVVVLSILLVAAFLLVPRPHPPKRSQTPFAPLGAIQKARDAASASDAANAALQRRAAQAAGEIATP